MNTGGGLSDHENWFGRFGGFHRSWFYHCPFRQAQTCSLADLEVFVDLVTSEAEVEDGIGLSQSVGDFGDRRPTSEPARDLYSTKEQLFFKTVTN